MPEQGLQRLAADLRVPADDLAFLQEVDVETRQRLHRALVAAREQQERALAEAFDGAIRRVPRPLRGRLRRLLLGR